MNYRHAYHAGNFADVLKHAVIALILTHLTRKETPFRVIDTHAGIGLYDLASTEAGKTQEWRAGIGRLLEARIDPDVAPLLAPYLEAVTATRGASGLPLAYPGSPEIARHLSRAQDRMVFVEKHPHDAALLAASVAGDRRAKVIELDGWTALKAFVPPVERRGLVLVDPPFEEPGEYARMAQALDAAWQKWPTGIYTLWYPIKDTREADAFRRMISQGPVRKALCVELMVNEGRDPRQFNGAGLVIVNPPWTLLDDCHLLLPFLSRVLKQEAQGRYRLDWLTGEA